MDTVSRGRNVFDREIEALTATRECLGGVFLKIVDLIVGCRGKVIVTGMGKSGHIARKIAATFSSLGASSFFLHPAEALHGDLGMVGREDVVIAISHSGESDEINRILPAIKLSGAVIVAITGKAGSAMARYADIVQLLPDCGEACILGLAPTSSTTQALCYGDALAVAVSERNGFCDIDFGRYHPAGALGKKITITVDELMVEGENNAVGSEDMELPRIIILLSSKGLGIVSITDSDHRLLGVITDGDLRRQLEKGADIYHMTAKDIMTRTPKYIESGSLAVDALNRMKAGNIASMPVVEGGRVIGTIRLQAIIGTGIV